MTIRANYPMGVNGFDISPRHFNGDDDLERDLEMILSEEDFSDFCEEDRHKMLDRLDVYGEQSVRDWIRERMSGE